MVRSKYFASVALIVFLVLGCNAAWATIDRPASGSIPAHARPAQIGDGWECIEYG
jgi:hypothetical protein